MPRVPLYDRQVAPQALPTPTLHGPAGNPLGALGKGIGRLGQTMFRIHREEVERENALVLTENMRALGEWEQEHLFGEDGALNRRGKDALGVAGDVIERFDKQVAEMSRGLTEEQRTAFLVKAAQRREWIRRTLEVHEFRERKAFDAQETEATLQTFRTNAVLYGIDPDRVSKELREGEAVVRSHAARNGWGEEQTARKVAEWKSSTIAAVIIGRIDAGKTREARAYWEEYRHVLTPEDRHLVERNLKAAKDSEEVLRLADQIFEANPHDLAEALKAARDVDPVLRVQVEQRIKTLFADQEAAEKYREEQLYEEAKRYFEAGDGRVEAIPRSLWQRLPLSVQGAFEVEETRRARGREPDTDWERWTEWELKSPEEKAKTNLFVELRPYVADTLYAAAVREQQQIKEALASRQPFDPSKVFTRVESPAKMAERVAREAGILPPQKSLAAMTRTEAARFNRWMLSFYDRLHEFELEHKRHATPREMQAILDEMAITTVRLDEWGRDTEVPLSTLADEEVQNAYVPVDQVPSLLGKGVRGILRRQMLPETDMQVGKTIAGYLVRDPAAARRMRAFQDMTPEEQKAEVARVKTLFLRKNREPDPDLVEQFLAASVLGDDLLAASILEAAPRIDVLTYGGPEHE